MEHQLSLQLQANLVVGLGLPASRRTSQHQKTMVASLSSLQTQAQQASLIFCCACMS